jgi:arsenate reductase (thioredoxin)
MNHSRGEFLGLDLNLRLEREANQLAKELAGVFDAATVREQVFAAERALPEGKVDDFRHVFAWRYARDVLRSLARSRGLGDATKPQVLFVCVHNAGRSQMASAFASAMGGDRVEVLSAGSAPAQGVNPTAVDAMREVGIDLASSFPKPLKDELVRGSDVVITMGCGDTCPVFPGKQYEDWPVDDPSGRPIEEVRAIRDDIRERVRALLERLGVPTGD